jgi:hypothetical protein
MFENRFHQKICAGVYGTPPKGTKPHFELNLQFEIFSYHPEDIYFDKKPSH